uniref:hypothetical protein n=1 Tax=uncultured Erythrobacter sp. TaxID=263913 RepID=UPI00263A3C61|nr:hypothetical protein [uncultured Erythrobacter sp.]
MLSLNRTGAFAGLVAAASLTAIPAQAAELPAAPAPVAGSAIFTDFGQSTYSEGDAIAEHHRRWGRHRYRRNRVNAGDVLTGVLILGGIAAVASAANNKERRNRDTDYRRERNAERDYDRRDERRDDQRSDRRSSNAGSGLDNAAEQCVARIERDIRVESVDSVNRTSEGWIVTGALFNGNGFTCQIDNNGRIADVNYGGFQASNADNGDANRSRGDDRQWSDDRYADARAKARSTQRSDAATPTQQQPAYPGGPIPGDEYPGDVDADLRG